MTSRLRDLIHAVRKCKTAEEERATINKESALMRTAFREGKAHVRERNMAKLLFMHMLGYPTHWGQMESVKLISSPKFHEKRVGYLALTMLLDERADLLTLVVNSVARDLKHESVYVNALALTVVANIASKEVARDLCPAVVEHIVSGSTYTKKKAALALINVVRKCPELVGDLVPKVVNLLMDRSHSVLLATVTLLTHMLEADPALGSRFVRLVPALCKVLRKLAGSSFAREYTVSGVVDPFLQVRILRLLRAIGTPSPSAAETLNEVLALVTTRTEATKTAGHAVLYEAVQTVLSVEAESGLRVLAVNTLGAFLNNVDNNIRYVALQTLCNVVERDRDAVLRNRGTIVECLRDNDVSLRRRALDLVFALTDKDNVENMVAEMVNYLVVATDPERPPLCARIAAVTRRFAPSKRWEIDVLAVVLALAGDHTKSSVLARLAHLVSSLEDDHSSLVHKFYAMLLENVDSPDVQRALLNITAWVTGELGELLLDPPPSAPDRDPGSIPYGPIGEVRTEMDVIATLAMLLDHHAADQSTRCIVLTALLKLAARFPTRECRKAIRSHVGRFSRSADAELQQRSVEFSLLVGGEIADDELLAGVLERVPVLRDAVVRHMAVGDTAGEAADLVADAELQEMDEEEGQVDLEADDEDPFGFGAALGRVGDAIKPDIDHEIGALFGSSPSKSRAHPPPPSSTHKEEEHEDDIEDIFGPSSSPSPSPTPPKPTKPTIQVFEGDGVRVTFELDKTEEDRVTVTSTALNTSTQPIETFALQSAVPKYMKQKLMPASSASMAPGESITQVIHLQNTSDGAKPYKLRLRFRIKPRGAPEELQRQAAVDSFPI